MPKALCIVGMVVAALLLLVFGLDFAIKVPFGRANAAMDVGFVLATAIVAALGWLTLREQT